MASNMVGIKGKLYYNSATFGSPTWVEHTLIRDLQRNFKPNIATAVTRASRAEKGAPTTYDLSITGTMLSDVDSTIYLAQRTAFLAGTVWDIMCLTGAHSSNGEEGLRYEAVVGDASQGQGSGDVMYDNFEFRPHIESANAVQTVLVASGAPVFTTFA